MDPERVAPLIKRAREEAGLSFDQLAANAGTTSRSVQRWESAFVPPTRSYHADLIVALGGASVETWRALVEALGFPLDAALAKVPIQVTKALPPPAPPPPPPAPPPPDPRAVLDDAVRATAEELDVSPRKVRAAFAQLVVDLERLGLSYVAARDVLLGRGAAGKSSR